MSQIIKQNTGGGGESITFTPDEGGVISPVTNLNVFGATSGTSNTPILTTDNVAGDLIIEPRAYNTQYVVDPSSTVGQRGTYATIQAALDAAVVDGMAFNNQKVIYIRTGSYTEDLVIPGGAILTGESLSFAANASTFLPQSTVIRGAHTFTGNAVCGFNNLIFVTATGDMFDLSGAAVALIFMFNCTLTQAGTGGLFPVPCAGGGTINLINSNFSGAVSIDAFNLTNMTLIMNSCVFSQPLRVTIGAGTFQCFNTVGIGHTVLLAGGVIDAIASSFINGETFDYIIDASTPGDLGNAGNLRSCYFSGNYDVAAVSAADVGLSWYIQNCATGSISDPQAKLYANDADVNSFGSASQGNLIKSLRVATNFNVTTEYYYVGVTDTSSARTINLPNGTTNMTGKDQTFIIKDESGGALVNNITVTSLGSVALIDGAVTKVINTNYGFIRVIFDGTNYFTI